MEKKVFILRNITSSHIIILIDRDDGKKKQKLA